MIRPFHSSPLIPFLLFFVLGSDAVFSAPTHTPTATRSPSPSPTPGPLPDLTIYGPAANPFLITQIYFFTSCEVVEGCVAEGTRRLLRFTTQTRNIGAGDLYLGNPSGNPLFHFSECHGHYHLDNYMEYRLKDGANQIVVGYKQGFCLLDSLRFDPGANPSPIYNCVNQGIQAGWADEYVADLPCQYIDVTGVAAGTYTLEMEVNPQRVLMETNYANNITTLTIVIPALPSPTPTPSPTASPSPTSSPSPTLPPPVILRQPADQKANAGQDIVFSIEAAGTPSPDYQWFKGASSLAGKTTPTLTLPDVALSDAGGYACLASNANGSARSTTATLTIYDPPQPNSALYLSNTAPPLLAPGQGIWIGITMRDNSNVSWSAAQGYSLGVISDPANLFLGAGPFPIEPLHVVKSNGGTYSFLAFIVAPGVPGDVSAQLQMMETGLGGFGQGAVVAITVAEPANRARDWMLFE